MFRRDFLKGLAISPVAGVSALGGARTTDVASECGPLITQDQLRAVLDEQNRTFQSRTVQALQDARRHNVKV